MRRWRGRLRCQELFAFAIRLRAFCGAFCALVREMAECILCSKEALSCSRTGIFLTSRLACFIYFLRLGEHLHICGVFADLGRREAIAA
jgi:hypothetical protein